MSLLRKVRQDEKLLGAFRTSRLRQDKNYSGVFGDSEVVKRESRNLGFVFTTEKKKKLRIKTVSSEIVFR